MNGQQHERSMKPSRGGDTHGSHPFMCGINITSAMVVLIARPTSSRNPACLLGMRKIKNGCVSGIINRETLTKKPQPDNCG